MNKINQSVSSFDLINIPRLIPIIIPIIILSNITASIRIFVLLSL